MRKIAVYDILNDFCQIPGEAASTETGMAGKKTIETVKAAERIMEALELYKEETEKLQEYEAQCKLHKKKVRFSYVL